VKWIALALLCSCAPVVSAPSSLPFVRVDPTLAGAVMSPEAMRVALKRRADDRAKCNAEKADCEARAKTAERGQAQALKDLAVSLWWKTWAPIMVLVTAAASFVGGLAAGFGIAR
jgi:hypothetical protein